VEKPALTVHVTSLFLRDEEQGQQVLNEEVPHLTVDILFAVSHSLRRLAIDRPFRSLYPEDEEHLPLEHRIRPKYRAALESCKKLEELICVQDELFVGDRFDFEVWPQLAHLRRLSLYNPLIGTELLQTMQSAQSEHGQSLEVFVGVRSDHEDEMEKAELDNALGKLQRFKRFVLWNGKSHPSPGMERLEGGLVERITLVAWDAQDEIRVWIRDGRMPWFGKNVKH